MATEAIVPGGSPGDERVGVWVQLYEAELLQLACRNRYAQALVEDALQELWLALLHTSPPAEVVADEHRLRAWLFGALRRRLSDVLRKERHRTQCEIGENVAIDADPLAMIESEGMANRVRAILVTMTAQGAGASARLLELRFIDGMTAAQLGELLSIPARSVSARLQRAKHKFQRLWTESD